MRSIHISRLFSKYAPEAKEISDTELNRLFSFIVEKKPFLITESGIPDYRSPNGSYSRGHKPMQYLEFLASETNRQRYWVRNMNGFRLFSSVRPNIGHIMITELQNRGFLNDIVTQNVDSLHQNSGAKDVTNLHGSNYEVICVSCRTVKSRVEFQDVLEKDNTSFLVDDLMHPEQRADGDADIRGIDYSNFKIPACDSCGGILKPNVVFFGENTKPGLANEIISKIDKYKGLLVVGSSLQVFSSFRFVRNCHEKNIPVAILNIGETRGDPLASLKIEARIGSTLEKIVGNL